MAGVFYVKCPKKSDTFWGISYVEKHLLAFYAYSAFITIGVSTGASNIVN